MRTAMRRKTPAKAEVRNLLLLQLLPHPVLPGESDRNVSNHQSTLVQSNKRPATGKATLRVPKSAAFVAAEDDTEEPIPGAGQEEAATLAESSKQAVKLKRVKKTLADKANAKEDAGPRLKVLGGCAKGAWGLCRRWWRLC